MRNSECGIKWAVFQTPLGWAGAAASDHGICRVVLPKKDKKSVEKELSLEAETRSLEHDEAKPELFLNKAVMLLKNYFSGKRISVDLWIDLRAYTLFQQAVWKAAARIPWGETRSYGGIAKQIKRPKAARAVGQAMGANPVPVFIP